MAELGLFPQLYGCPFAPRPGGASGLGERDVMEKDEREELSRREFLAWAAAAAALVVLPGCDGSSPVAYSQPAGSRVRPAPAVYQSAYASPAVPTVVEAPQPQVKYVYVQQEPIQPAPNPRVVRPASAGKVSAMSRNSWGATPAIPAKMKPMNGVSRVTIHHEGSAKPNNDVSPAQVAETLRLIQSQHRKRMGAGDIGYHFIIDRTGTVWQGRDWAYQGAHTSGANSNNIGIMLLGNFEIQQPTPEQLAAMRQLTASVCRKYGLSPAKDIFGHCDFGNTQCPGRALKPQVAAMRKNLKV